MNDEISILISAILQKTTKQELAKQLKSIESQLPALEIKSDIDANSVKIYRNAVDEAYKKVKQFTDEQNRLVTLTQKFNKESQSWEKVGTVTVKNYLQEKKLSDTIQTQIKLLQTRIQLLKTNYWTADFKELDSFSQKVDVNKIDPTNYKVQLADLKNQYQVIANAVQESHRNNLAVLQEELKLESQKNASVMQNWAKQLEIDAQMRKAESDRIKLQMQSNAQMDAQTKELQNQIELYKQRMALESKKLMGREYNTYVDKKALEELNNEIQSLNVDTPELEKKMKQFSLRMNELGVNAKAAANSIKNVNRDGYGLSNMISIAAKKFIVWQLAVGGVMNAIRGIREGINIIRELDSAMVEIAKVTDLTAGAMERLKDGAFDAASAYGQTAQAYLKSIAEFSRAGYEEQSESLAKISLLAQNVGELTEQQANEFLLATDAAYKYKGSQEELMRVLDGINKIDNEYATSIAKISDGITVAGSIAANASVGIDELAAAIGTMTAVTQRSGNETGRAFRSILMNLRQIKGEFEDGEVIDDAQLSKTAEALNAVGIKIHEVRNGIRELRDPMEILKELSSIWGSLSSMKQAPIIDALGGKFRGNEHKTLTASYVQKCA